VEIVIISDTHMPRGPRALPPQCVERLEAADAVVHAGDLCTLDVLEQLKAFNPRVIAVHGNQDDGAVQTALPAVVTMNLGASQIAVVHDAGPARSRLGRLRRRFPAAAAVIFGHSHIPLHERAPDGFQIFNPGSPTERRRAPHHTMGIARAKDQAIEFELIELD
jgi:hypothetical protein